MATQEPDRWSRARPFTPDGPTVQEFQRALDETPFGKVIIHTEDGKPVRVEINQSRKIG